MASALSIITAALRRISVVSGLEEPDAQTGQMALEELNRMLAAYKARGCTNGIQAAVPTISTDLTLNEKYHDALIALLVPRLARYFGIQIDAQAMEESRFADRLILKDFVVRGTFGVDPGLQISSMSGTPGYGIAGDT